MSEQTAHTPENHLPAGLTEITRRAGEVAGVLSLCDDRLAHDLVEQLNIDSVLFGFTGRTAMVASPDIMLQQEVYDSMSRSFVTQHLEASETIYSKATVVGYTSFVVDGKRSLAYRLELPAKASPQLSFISALVPVQGATLQVADETIEQYPLGKSAILQELKQRLKAAGAFDNHDLREELHGLVQLYKNQVLTAELVQDVGAAIADIMMYPEVSDNPQVRALLLESVYILVDPSVEYAVTGHLIEEVYQPEAAGHITRAMGRHSLGRIGILPSYEVDEETGDIIHYDDIDHPVFILEKNEQRLRAIPLRFVEHIRPVGGHKTCGDHIREFHAQS